MELFVAIFNGFQPLTFVTKSPALDFASVQESTSGNVFLVCYFAAEIQNLIKYKLATKISIIFTYANSL